MLINELDDLEINLFQYWDVSFDSPIIRRAIDAIERLAAEFVSEEDGVWNTTLMSDIGKTYATREAALSRVILWAETGE